MEQFDAIIVGAGPAGSSAAHHLASAGASVLLLDRARFPRDKPCGGGLTGRAVQLLPETARRKLMALSQRATDLHAAMPPFEQIRELAETKMRHANRIADLLRPKSEGGFGLPEPAPQVVRCVPAAIVPRLATRFDYRLDKPFDQLTGLSHPLSRRRPTDSLPCPLRGCVSWVPRG